jgi:hypothetical protein
MGSGAGTGFVMDALMGDTIKIARTRIIIRTFVFHFMGITNSAYNYFEKKLGIASNTGFCLP